MGCSACDAEIELASGVRVGFRETCPRCDADLHACVQCAHYDTTAARQCREPAAEPVAAKDRANHCDWFRLTVGATSGGEASERDRVRSRLDSLFKKPGGG
jgi:hypothetical protein